MGKGVGMDLSGHPWRTSGRRGLDSRKVYLASGIESVFEELREWRRQRKGS